MVAGQLGGDSTFALPGTAVKAMGGISEMMIV
jgi:hypothetical protein